MLLAIDGYNIIKQSPELRRLEQIELQKAREGLIEELARYKRLKGHAILVVFDGWQGGWGTEKRERQKGMDLVFSKRGEKADEVIKRMVKEKGAGVVVVTSDREISRFAERMSVSAVSSEQFLERMENRVFEVPGERFAEEEEERGQAKRGLSRRPSKKERRARRILKKI